MTDSYDSTSEVANADGDGDDSVDSRPAAPLEDSRPNDGSDTDSDGGEVEPDEDSESVPVQGRRNEDLPTETEGQTTEGGQMTHIDNAGLVVGRRNEDLPTENLVDNS